MVHQSRSRNVTAVLGPTNTGKTHLAIERMLGHPTGMIGLPLRLLAREVYDKIVARVGAANVALVTGEEKIKPESPRFWVSTVEAMPREVETDFLAIDEVQLCADPDRGHVFTDRLLSARGRSETLLLGAATMREAINDLIPGANFISRPRLSKLSYSGQKKITRLPKRSAIVAFSASEVYAIAELIRRQLGGAAVVLGALSPRTRNAQVALYQSGDVDYMVATDAVGMGLNLDVDHVAFAATRKFDGQHHRNLTPGELGQIAGRAGRHMNDGTFGVTADVEPFEADLIERLETHTFDTIRTLQWRNANLDFRSLDGLRESLRQTPGEPRLQRARMADDVMALEAVSADRQIADTASTPAAVEKLWEVAQVPDYRKISSQNHAELVATLYGFLMGGDGRIPEDWFTKQVALADRTDGDIDTLANRIAHIRTWTFVSNRSDWLKDPVHWQGRTRAIEDSLSDALHEQLTQRFVDKRTSALMRGLRDKEEMNAEVAADGSITVENHFVGKLKGFRFQPDAQSEAQGIHGKAARNAAAHVLSKELGMRARRVASAKADAFKLSRSGAVLWRDEEIARLEAGEDPLKPSLQVLCDEHLNGPDKEKVQARLDQWIQELIAERLKPLITLKTADDVAGLARGIAFRMTESFGALKRESVAEEIKQLDQPARAQLRKYGVRFGAFNIFLPLLLKPGPAELSLVLWSLKNAAAAGLAMDALPEPPRAGLTSAVAQAATPEAYYRAGGYHLCGPRAIRMDILERLADLIRPLLAWRVTESGQTPPKGSSGDGGFMVTPEMMSILGCSSDELGNVLKALGFRLDRRPAEQVPALRLLAAQAAAPKVDSEAAVPETAPAVAAEAAAGANGDDAELASEEPAGAGEPVAAVTADVAAEPALAAAAPEPVGAGASEPVAAAKTEPLPDATMPAPEAAEASVAAEATPAAAEQATATGAQPADAAAVSEAEVRMIDIWRPRRRDRPERRPRHGERRGEQQGQGREGGERREGGRPGGQQHRDRNRDRDRNRRQGPQAAQAEAATAASAGGETQAAVAPAAAGAPAQHQRPPRDDKRPGRDGRPFQKGGPKDGGRGGPDRRDDRRDRDDRRRREERPRFESRSASPQRKGGGIDPDSPFAALSALKQQLEKQTKDRG